MINNLNGANVLESQEQGDEDSQIGDGRAFNNGADHEGEAPRAEENSSSDIASQADVLLKLIHELRSITDRACDAAVRESECAERIEESRETEVARLQVELKEKEELLAARDAAMREAGDISRATIQTLEIQLRERQTEVKVREIELEDMKAKFLDVTKRLQLAELQNREGSAQLQSEMTDLRHQLQATQTELQAKEHELRHSDGDLKAKNQDLQARLQDTEGQLRSREAELKDKENLLQAAAARETEVGKLIARLSEECGKLSAELQEKSLIVAQLEKKHRPLISEGRVWKKVLGRIHDQAS